MRKIKFRGLCNAGGEMHGKFVFGDLLQKNGKTYITPHVNVVEVKGHIGRLIIMHEVDPKTVGEYSGLQDKNDKEIYEGDVLSWRNYNNVEFVGVVTEKPGVTYIDCMKPTEYPSYIFEASTRRTDIIGNIYEHPHLLEQAVQT